MRGSNRWLWIALGVLVVLMVAGPTFGVGLFAPRAGIGAYGARPFIGAWPWLAGFGLGIGLLIRVLVWGGLLLLVVSLFRGRRPRGWAHDDPDPLDILNRRYASGEITREQYEEMRRTLAHLS
jgi:putative membrane protein